MQNARMNPRSIRSLWLAALWLALGAAGCAVLMHTARERWSRDRLAEARIVLQALAQQAARHDAVLATLSSLQPDAPALEGALRRIVAASGLPLTGVRARGVGQTWPLEAGNGWVLAEAESRRTGRAVLVPSDGGSAAWWLLRAADPSSYAIGVDPRSWQQAAARPWLAEGRTRSWLQSDGLRLPLVSSSAPPSAWDGWFEQLRWPLPTPSQPFELVVESTSGWAAWPWAEMAAWVMLSAVAVIAAEAWAEQRMRRRLAELRLRHGRAGQAEALGEWAAGLQSQLQRPLATVLDSARAGRQVLEAAAPDLSAAREAIDQAARQARQATEVIDRLRRTVERPAWGGRLQAVRLDELLRDALELIEPECTSLGVFATVATEPGARSVQADPLALEQIVHNLLSNALQALALVPAGERQLELSAAARGGHAVLTVRDTGPGIPDDALPRLFEPFFSTRSGGTGLGLSLCDTLASRMGGSLTGGNAAPRGAQFELALPLG